VGLSPASDWLARTLGRAGQGEEAPAPAKRHPVTAVAILTVIVLAGLEIKTSWAQSHLLAAAAARLKFTVTPSASSRINYPAAGPYDQRLGYSLLPEFLERLHRAGYTIEDQARISKWAMWMGRLGIYPIYREKNRAGIEIAGEDGVPLYAFHYPHRVYPNFNAIPPVVVRTLLFIENRHLLENGEPYENPAVEWGRLAHAAMDFGVHQVDRHRSVIGGSTLATQLEKLRHSPEGRTHSPFEKLRQIGSASLRIYQDGPRTGEAQRRVICDYINSIPLSAAPGQGEVTGLGDGLAAWYGADFDQVNRALAAPGEDSPREMRDRARAYREVLSLFLALREPSRYMVHDPAALAAQTDRYLSALAKDGVISARLRDAALQERISPHAASAPPVRNFAANKASQALRMRLLGLLGLSQTYLLDRLDLDVKTTVNRSVQDSVTQFFEQVADGKRAQAAGLEGFQLLPPGDPGNVIYSFTLYERGPGVNYLRAEADNLNQPLNINSGTKLQLGSTAKLRTLITYLQIVEALHAEYGSFTPQQLAKVPIEPGDKLTAWAIEYLSTATDRSVNAMLSAALERKYSGNPGESFFTAGGLHTFENFERSENFQSYTVRQGFEQSVNLVYIRLMRDIDNYYKWRAPGASPAVLSDPDNPARINYLRRFADDEGSTFLGRFYAKYRGQTPDQALATLVESVHPAPWRVAVIYRSVRPDADFAAFTAFMQQHVPAPLLANQNLEKLYTNYAPDKFNLSDRGYLAHVHPLELWLVAYLAQHPRAPFSEVVAHSAAERQEVYRWLFRPKERHGQDVRIGIMLEQDAFHEIWKSWKRLGYPFNYLVPSYATAIGVSGDTPAALAELAGIIANDGVLNPVEDIREIRFGAGTPMETSLVPNSPPGERVLSPEIARLVHDAMLGVVANGTGRRAFHAFVLPGGKFLPVAGKTGTGDNRFKVFARGGGVIADRPVNRTATFVFIAGDRLFGTVTAFVPSQTAGSYSFTSALAVQILKDLAPRLRPLIAEPDTNTRERAPSLSRLIAREH
jgi:membrane peptidoglycan carboxypeptidase